MFKKIVVAYNESPESERALVSAIRLAESINAELHSVTVVGDLPAYTAYAGAVDGSVSRVLKEDQMESYERLQQKARSIANNCNIDLRSHIIEGSKSRPSSISYASITRTFWLSGFISEICLLLACGVQSTNWRKRRRAAYWEYIRCTPWRSEDQPWSLGALKACQNERSSFQS